MTEKDIMSDLINDISMASGEALNEAAEEVQEVIEDAKEQVEEVQEEVVEIGKLPAGAETIVVKFDDELEAARAVRIINKALRQRHETIYQGAVVRRKNEAELDVEDFSDLGLADLVKGTAVIYYDLGKDGFKLIWTTATAGIGLIVGGIRLLRRTALLAAGMSGATLTMRKRRNLDAFNPETDVESSTADLAPGETAVVIVADHQTANDLATDLVRSGGELA